MSTIDLITQKTGVAFRPASAPAIEARHALGAPEEIVAFYRQPSKYIEIGEVGIWPVAHMLEENRDYVPGCYARPCGNVVLSTTIYGAAYCFDLRAAPKTGTPIVLIEPLYLPFASGNQPEAKR
jgi:hypothetical protein